DPDGVNINASCGSTYAAGLGPAVVAAGADLGLAFDGDADRLIALDHLGQVVDGDHLLAMFSLDLHRRGELAGNGMVVTVMSNLGLRRSLSAAGIRVVETPVGDRHVADALEREGLVLGGEQSGHVIFAREATTGDGLLTALKLLELVAREGRPLSELAAESRRRLPHQLVTVAVERPRALAEAELVWREVAAVEAELGDAGRVLLRPSGTESAVRVMVEADSPEIATVAVKRLVEVVERELGSLAPR
ncbi:MAG: phosphoglucosamine mutase, partial [Acidimicrobiaceae bacterium]|nr:phosphoglucosamine mutase [Acidimicrobiaceae bacterium]